MSAGRKDNFVGVVELESVKLTLEAKLLELEKLGTVLKTVRADMGEAQGLLSPTLLCLPSNSFFLRFFLFFFKIVSVSLFASCVSAISAFSPVVLEEAEALRKFGIQCE